MQLGLCWASGTSPWIEGFPWHQPARPVRTPASSRQGHGIATARSDIRKYRLAARFDNSCPARLATCARSRRTCRPWKSLYHHEHCCQQPVACVCSAVWGLDACPASRTNPMCTHSRDSWLCRKSSAPSGGWSRPCRIRTSPGAHWKSTPRCSSAAVGWPVALGSAARTSPRTSAKSGTQFCQSAMCGRSCRRSWWQRPPHSEWSRSLQRLRHSEGERRCRRPDSNRRTLEWRLWYWHVTNRGEDLFPRS